MRNVYMFRNVREVLVKDVNTSPPPTPLMITRQHAQRVRVPQRNGSAPQRR